MMRMKREKMKKENLKRKSLEKIVSDPKVKSKIPTLHLRTGEKKRFLERVWRCKVVCLKEVVCSKEAC